MIRYYLLKVYHKNKPNERIDVDSFQELFAYRQHYERIVDGETEFNLLLFMIFQDKHYQIILRS